MAVKKESIQQTTTGTWAASSVVTVQLDRIGLATRYDVVFDVTPSATLIAANQPDALWRPFRNIQFQAGGLQYMAMPDEAGGHGGTLLHHLNKMDGFGMGFLQQLIVAPSQTFYPPRLVFHCGVRPFRKDGSPNQFDLTAFLPAGIESSPQIVWQTTANSVMDDIVTLSSGTLRITAHRVLGTTADIKEEMERQGVNEILDLIRSGAEGLLPEPDTTGLIPSWYGQVQSPTATATNYGLEIDAQLGGFLTRYTTLAQDATATRPVRADDELTQIRLIIPEKGVTILQLDTEQLTVKMNIGDFLVADDAVDFGVSPAAGGIYPIDLRPYGPTTLEQILGLDTRGRQSGYAKWGQTVGTNASGDDFLSLTQRLLTYKGRLSNS